MRKSHSLTGAAILLLILFCPVTAQELAYLVQQEDTVASQAGEIKIFNDLLIPEGTVRSGAIRVIGGNLTVAGRVTGRITVIGGDVELQPTALIEGTIVALGGQIYRSEGAVVTGNVLEVNRGKVSLTTEEADQIFGYDDDLDERLERLEGEEEDEEEWEPVEIERVGQPWRLYSQRYTLPDFEVSDDPIVRYNRSEGLGIYFPFNPDTDDIPGFHIRGMGGAALAAHRWYGRVGVGQYILRGRIGLVVEGHIEPRHDDGWRITPKENSLAAFFVHQDWYDRYEAEGYGATFVAGLPPLVEVKARYRNENHSTMENVTEWSLFSRDLTFNDAYAITEGKDVNLRYEVTFGRPIDYFPRRIQASLSYAYTQTMPEGDFDYTRDDLTLEAFVPLHSRLGIRLNARTGAVYSDTDDYGLQHLVPIGGIGSVQGYRYKDLDNDGLIDLGNHYAVINATFSLMQRFDRDHLSLMWQAGLNWDSDDRILTGDYFSELEKNAYHAVGIGLGGDDARLEFMKPLNKDGDQDWVVYLRILDN